MKLAGVSRFRTKYVLMWAETWVKNHIQDVLIMDEESKLFILESTGILI